MKFNNILMLLNQDTTIRLVVTLYGVKFTSDHYPEYYLDHFETDELLEKNVINMRIVDNMLECELG